MKKSLVIFISLLIISSCSSCKSGFVVKHKQKDIKLKGVKDSIKIGFETDSAIIYFGYNDIKEVTKRKLVRNAFYPKLSYEQTEEIKINLKFLDQIRTDKSFRYSIDSNAEPIDYETFMFTNFISQYIFRELILNKRADVFNKGTKDYEKAITYHFYKDRFGGETCFYTFENKQQFHWQMITLGE